MANPATFARDPHLAWGFYGHRLHLYRRTVPHDGFRTLLRWGQSRPGGYFVFTSNVDGQFQKAGFDPQRVLECHGTIHYLQCTQVCTRDIWWVDDLTVDVDPETIRARSEQPVCPRCGAVARPNILMFGDWEWVPDRTRAQQRRYAAWLQRVAGKRVVAVEMGAGLAIPTVRDQCEERASTLIRINPREPEAPPGAIELPLGALAALTRMAGYF